MLIDIWTPPTKFGIIPLLALLLLGGVAQPARAGEAPQSVESRLCESIAGRDDALEQIAPCRIAAEKGDRKATYIYASLVLSNDSTTREAKYDAIRLLWKNRDLDCGEIVCGGRFNLLLADAMVKFPDIAKEVTSANTNQDPDLVVPFMYRTAFEIYRKSEWDYTGDRPLATSSSAKMIIDGLIPISSPKLNAEFNVGFETDTDYDGRINFARAGYFNVRFLVSDDRDVMGCKGLISGDAEQMAQDVCKWVSSSREFKSPAIGSDGRPVESLVELRFYYSCEYSDGFEKTTCHVKFDS